jgi:hypothetical protein
MSSKDIGQSPDAFREQLAMLSPLADFFVKGLCHEMNIFLMAYKFKSVLSVYALVIF